MNAIHPAFVQALRPFAPAQQLPTVKCRRTRSGRVSEYEFRSNDAAASRKAAEHYITQVDPYRSPAVVAQRNEGEEFVVVVRYYSVD